MLRRNLPVPQQMQREGGGARTLYCARKTRCPVHKGHAGEYIMGSQSHPDKQHTTFLCSISAPSSSSSLTHARWPAGTRHRLHIREPSMQSLSEPADSQGLYLTKAKQDTAVYVYSPLPAASSNGGSPQWSDSFNGAP